MKGIGFLYISVCFFLHGRDSQTEQNNQNRLRSVKLDHLHWLREPEVKMWQAHPTQKRAKMVEDYSKVLALSVLFGTH